jgi:hypothetical protein
MDQNSWIMLLVGIAIACAVFALGVVLYPKLKSEKQGYPLEVEIEAALLPFIFNGICSAYRLSERSMDEIQRRIQGADKKKLAAEIYALLPSRIGNYEITIVKHYVTQEHFEKMLQDRFNSFDFFFEERQGKFQELFEKWKAKSNPTSLLASETEDQTQSTA